MQNALLTLYRDPRLPITVGERVVLDGVTIEMTEVTADGRLAAARFDFDRPLESPELQFVYWNATAYAPFRLPAIERSRQLPAAELPLTIPFDFGS